MELTHTGDNRLTTLLVGTYGECRVFLSQLSQTVVELGNVSLRLRLYSDRDHGIGEGHRLQHDGLLLVTEGVTRTDILETYTCTDITSVDRLHRNLLVGVHLEQTADALFLARTWVIDIRTCLHATRVDAEEHQTSHIGVGGNLKGEGCRRLCLAGLASLFLLSVGVGTCHHLHIHRSRQESTYIVEQRLYALVLIR